MQKCTCHKLGCDVTGRNYHAQTSGVSRPGIRLKAGDMVNFCSYVQFMCPGECLCRPIARWWLTFQATATADRIWFLGGGKVPLPLPLLWVCCIRQSIILSLCNYTCCIITEHTQRRVYALRHECIVLGKNMEKSKNIFIGKYTVLSQTFPGFSALHTGT